jgi:hypothetical protein
MTQTLARQKTTAPVTVEQALVLGDLSGLDPEQRVNYYMKVCTSLGLNPLTKPFAYIVLNGQLQLYARKDATDQLRKIHKLSIRALEHKTEHDLAVVTAYASSPDGRTDSAIGAVPIANLKGEALANALMKAETKAKRRVTLSLCGLGMTDESEVDSIPGAYLYPEPTPPDGVPGEAYVPTREREVDDRDLVRSADERIWQNWLRILAEAQSLGLNPKTVTLPIERDELKIRGNQLRSDIRDRQDQLDNEEAARVAARAHEAANARDEDLDAVETQRQRRMEGLK